MRAGEGWVASRYVHFALAVEVLRGFAYLLLVAMPSIATFQTGPMVSVLSLPRPVIVLDAISKSFYFALIYFWVIFLVPLRV